MIKWYIWWLYDPKPLQVDRLWQILFSRKIQDGCHGTNICRFTKLMILTIHCNEDLVWSYCFLAFMGWYGPLLPMSGVCVHHICVDQLESKMADCVYGENKKLWILAKDAF